MNCSQLLLLLLAIASVSSIFAAPLFFDLDAPGALGRLRDERPEHFQKVVRILHDAQGLPEKEVIGWLRTHYQTESASFGPTLLVSYPPKRRLTFSLDTVRYHATVIVTVPQAVAVPAY